MANFQEMDSTFTYPEATALEAKGTDKVLREKLLPPPNIPILNFFFGRLFSVLHLGSIHSCPPPHNELNLWK